MPIDVYQLRDLFWDNNSYKVPNTIPTQFIKQTRFNKKAKIHDYFGGTIRLKGDNWNWAKYKGVYYFLKIIKVLDQDEKICLYALIRDTWTCVLKKGIIVRGDISTWNIDKDLEEHLNKCLPSLETHARIERLALSEDKEKWISKLASEVEPIKADLKQRVLSLRSWEWFSRRILDDELTKYKAAREYFYRDRNELFLFGVVNGELVTGWKEKLKEKINTWIKQLNNDNTTLVKVGSVSGYTTNKLIGHFALSPKNAKGGILGSPDTTQRITKIDLSGCTDLKLIRWDDLSAELDPNQDLLNNGFIDTGQEVAGAEEKLGIKFCWKVSRRLMLPIGSQDETHIDEVIPGDTAWMSLKTGGHFPNSFYGFDTSGWNLSYGNSKYLFRNRYRYWIKNEKQIIRFKERQGYKNQEEGFLYWVDKLDFVLSWKNNNGYVYPSSGIYENHSLYRVFSQIFGYQYVPPPATQFGGAGNPSYYYNRLIPHCPFDDGGKVWVKDKINPAPPYGLLLFQTVRNYQDWNGWEYLGDIERNYLFYYSGFNKTFWEVYGQNGNFWFNDHANTWRSLKVWAGNKGEALSRFMLHLDGVAFRLFTPDFYEYTYRYDWYNVWKLNDVADEPKYYVYEQLQNNYGKGFSRWLSPFKNKNTYIQFFETRRAPAIERVTIREKLDLPFTLFKGDYFFTDLEYYIRNFDSSFWLFNYDDVYDLKNKASKWDYESLKVLGDWINCRLDADYREVNKDDPGLNDEIISNNLEDGNNLGKVVLCTDNKGKLEVRTLKTFKKILNLAEGESNVIESVNDQTFKEVRFFHLSKKNFGVERITEQENTTKLNLLHVFYNLYGITTSRQSNKFLWLTDKEIESNEVPYLIDLVGTGFYACLKEGEIHLIAKDLQYVEEIEKEAGIKYSLESTNVGALQRLKSLSLLEKINQRNIVNYKTVPYPLQSRFKFDGKDKLEVKISGLKADDLQSTQDHFLFECKAEMDEISDLSSITKKAVKNIAFLPEQIQLDNLRLQQERADQDLALQLSEHRDFAKEKIKIARERAEYDLNYEWNTRLTDAIGSGISFFAGTAATFAGGAMAKSALAAAAATIKDAGGTATGKNVPQAASWGKKAIGLSTATRTTSFVGSLVDSIRWFTERYPEQSRRIKEDEAIQLKEVAYASFKFDQTHFRRKQDSKLQLNYIAKSFIRENVNDVTLSEKFIQKKNLSDTYLTILLPSEEQLLYLQRDRDEYGIDCDIPDTRVHIKNGMPANIMRFRNLRDEGFTGIENANERAFLKAKLEIGVKIVEIEQAEEHDFIFIEERRDYEDKVRNLQAEIQNLKYQLSEEELSKAKEVLEGCTKEKEEIEAAKKKIEADIEEINKKIQEKTQQLQEAQTKLSKAEEEGAKKQKELETSQRQRDIIEKSYNDAITAEQSAKQQVNQLSQEITQVKASNRQKNEQIERLKTKLERLDRRKALQHWDLCDFLLQFKEVNFDYNEMGKIILTAPSYGLNSSELNLYLWTLEYIDETLEMIRQFEEDNTSFFVNERDDTARTNILKPAFQDKIKKIREVATIIFLKALGRRLTDQEWGHVYKVKKLRPMFEDKILDQEVRTITQTNKTGIFDFKYPETMKAFDLYSFSNLQTKKLLKDRYWNVSGNFDDSIWNSNVYYDIADNYTGWQVGRILFAAYKRWQEAYHENNMHNMHRRVSVDDLFNIYYRDTSNYLKKGLGYEGRKGRQLYLGFIILHIVRIMGSYGRQSEQFTSGQRIFSNENDFRSIKNLTYYSSSYFRPFVIERDPEPYLDEWNQLYGLVCDGQEIRARNKGKK